MSELRDILKARFPQSALKSLYGDANLTTINGYAVIERLNDAFGIGGWRVEFDIVDQAIEEVVVFGRMYITLEGKEVRLSDTSGNMVNRKRKAGGWLHSLGDLVKGAGTNLIGKSASFIEVGIDVYKGLQSHNTPTIDWIQLTEAQFTKNLPSMREKWDKKIISETATSKKVKVGKMYLDLTIGQYEQLTK